KRLYYMTSKDNPSFLNTRMRNLEDHSDVLMNEGEGSPTFLQAVSEDESAYVFNRQFANTYVTGFVKVDDEMYSLTPDPEKVHVVFDPVFTDNQTVYFTTDYESDYAYLAKFDIATKAFSKVLEIENESIDHLKWDKE